MEGTRVPVTIIYRAANDDVPVFVAGSFTEPAWEPQRMRYTEDGQFVAQFELPSGREYQYKFKIGNGDAAVWELDEQKPITTDDVGNQNSVLIVPHTRDTHQWDSTNDQSASNRTAQSGGSGPRISALAEDLEVQVNDLPNVSSILTNNIRAATKASQSSATATQQPMPDDLMDEDDNSSIDQVLKTPLFAHESFGGYSFADDDTDLDEMHSKPHRSKAGYDFGDFAQDKSSMDAFRQLNPGWEQDMLRPDDFITPTYGGPRRTSWDSGDDSFASSGSLSPTSTRRRDSRLSHSSVGRTKSAVSLGSIAEEDQSGTRGLQARAPNGSRGSPPEPRQKPQADNAAMRKLEDRLLAMRDLSGSADHSLQDDGDDLTFPMELGHAAGSAAKKSSDAKASAGKSPA